MKMSRVLTESLSAEAESILLSAPAWPGEALEAFSPALASRIPARTESVEENTLPSCLWRHRAQESSLTAETTPNDVFLRLTGWAAYQGIKRGVWADDSAALLFRNEALFALSHRLLALDPAPLARLGRAWRYGQSAPSARLNGTRSLLPRGVPCHHLANADLDAVLGGRDLMARSRWNRLLSATAREGLARLDFADTRAEWTLGQKEAEGCAAPKIALDLLKFRRADQSLDLPALAQTARLAVLLLELISDEGAAPQTLQIGTVNLASLLMSLAIPYDSDKGRGMAAALTALVTAEALTASAELAALWGPAPTFLAARESCLRALRNQQRAVSGEANDYERLSIRPFSLTLESGVDLPLIAAARYAYDKALDKVRAHGLRHLGVTELFADPAFGPLLSSSAQGVDPEAALVRYEKTGAETFRRALNPAAKLGLAAARFDRADILALEAHARGYQTLEGAPFVHPAALKAKGFDAKALAKITATLPHVTHLRQAFTPWILGLDFCQAKLGLSPAQMLDERFDLLTHLGLSDEEIARADAICCGHGTFDGAFEFAPALAPVFATSAQIPNKARIQMAAAVQSFLTGDVGLILEPEAAGKKDATARQDLILDAWRAGLRGVTMFTADEPHEASKPRKTSLRPALKPTQTRATLDYARAAHPEALRPAPRTIGKPKASGRTISMALPPTRTDRRTAPKTRP